MVGLAISLLSVLDDHYMSGKGWGKEVFEGRSGKRWQNVSGIFKRDVWLLAVRDITGFCFKRFQDWHLLETKDREASHLHPATLLSPHERRYRSMLLFVCLRFQTRSLFPDTGCELHPHQDSGGGLHSRPLNRGKHPLSPSARTFGGSRAMFRLPHCSAISPSKVKSAAVFGAVYLA